MREAEGRGFDRPGSFCRASRPAGLGGGLSKSEEVILVRAQGFFYLSCRPFETAGTALRAERVPQVPCLRVDVSCGCWLNGKRASALTSTGDA